MDEKDVILKTEKNFHLDGDKTYSQIRLEVLSHRVLSLFR